MKPELRIATDICDSHVVKKDILPSIPFRFLLVGASGSGKSSLLSCMVALPSWYSDDFKGENIHIWSGSKGDNKINNLVDYKEIPPENLQHDWQDSTVSILYEDILNDWKIAVEEKKKPENKLFIIDDMFFSNRFRSDATKDSMLSKIFMNGRKFNVSIAILAQKYSSISTGIRENANSIITFGATNKQLDLIEADWNYLPSKSDFYKVFRKATENPYDFLFININLPLNKRYMNKDFESLYPILK